MPRHVTDQRKPALLKPSGAGAGEEEFFNECVPGAYVGLFYDDDPDVWHEALLVWPLDKEHHPWVILTPDGDLYEVPLLPPPLVDGPQRVAALNARGSNPKIPRGQFYRFREYPDGARLEELMRQARQEILDAGDGLLDAEVYLDSSGTKHYLPPSLGGPPRIRVHAKQSGDPRRVPATPTEAAKTRPPPGLGPPLSGGEPVLPSMPVNIPPVAILAAPRVAPVGKEWIVLEDVGEVAKRGDEVKLNDFDNIMGECALHSFGHGLVGCCRLVGAAEAIAVRAPKTERPEGCDARLLGDLVYDSHGTRYRDFSSSVRAMRQEPIDDFPLAGERSAAWLYRYILEHGGTPDARHTKWMQEQSIQRDSGAAHLHDMLGLALEIFLTFDQVDAGNLAGVEVIARAYQLLEETSGMMKIEGLEHYVGRARGGATRRGIALAPGMARYATEQLAKETEITKQRRKARDEKAAKGGKKGDP